MTDWVTCEVCESDADRDKCLRLTPWEEPITDDTEWCCARCAAKAFSRA